MTEKIDLFEKINDAVLDLQASQSQTFERPLKTLARLLNHPDIAEISRQLKEAVDFEKFMADSEETGGSMVGSAQLAWPDDQKEVLGLTLILIEKMAEDPNYAVNIGHHYFYSGNKTIAGIHSFVRQALNPFVRDYKKYIFANGITTLSLVIPVSNKIFIVHGRDSGPREAVARFLLQLKFEPIILNEQPNQGRTVIEKVEAHSDVGFAVVLLTPDDEGAFKGEPMQPRARQNVLLELGYFIGKLSRKRVCTLKAGDLDIPSDWNGVVDEPFDNTGGWKQTLARELRAAGYSIDWNKVMT